MDKLASKPYLHFSGHESLHKNVRPVGVPDTLRILTVDMPEVARQGFRHGHCSVDASRIYPDGIASPEIIEVKENEGRRRRNGNNKVSLPVEQKAWVKSMARCIADGSADHKVSVEIMEADVGRMNPNNMRRIHNYGTLRYDPGKVSAIESVFCCASCHVRRHPTLCGRFELSDEMTCICVRCH